MSTASITHRPIPMAAVGAAAVAVLAFVGVTLVNSDTSATAPSGSTSTGIPNPDASYLRPFHSGVQPGMP